MRWIRGLGDLEVIAEGDLAQRNRRRRGIQDVDVKTNGLDRRRALAVGVDDDETRGGRAARTRAAACSGRAARAFASGAAGRRRATGTGGAARGGGAAGAPAAGARCAARSG